MPRLAFVLPYKNKCCSRLLVVRLFMFEDVDNELNACSRSAVQSGRLCQQTLDDLKNTWLFMRSQAVISSASRDIRSLSDPYAWHVLCKQKHGLRDFDAPFLKFEATDDGRCDNHQQLLR